MKSKTIKMHNPIHSELGLVEQQVSTLTPLSLAVRASIVGLSLAQGAVQAATITVDSNLDDGVDCTLSEAIASAEGASNACAAGDSPGLDTIVFSALIPSNTIALSVSEGELSILEDNDLIINASNTNGPIVVDANNNSGVFFIEAATVTINSMTITGGSASEGGGLYVQDDSDVTLNDSTVSANIAVAGAGLWVDTSAITISNTQIIDNVASQYGGGIYGAGSTISLDKSTLDNNQAGNGGGLEANSYSTLSIIKTTVSNNTASSRGGGIRVSQSDATLQNTTFSGNLADQGGGLYFYEGSNAYIRNITVSNNTATTQGGGLFSYENVIYIHNSIIANSVGGDCYEPGNIPVEVEGFSIVQDGSCGATYSGDPGLLPLADNGGPTLTHALLESSIAINKIVPFGTNLADCTVEDQRDQIRDDGDMLCDMGAFELNAEGVPPGSGDDEVFYVIPLVNGKVVVIPL